MNRLNGFTLIEMLVVIAIIGILTALLIPTVTYVQRQANRDATTTDLSRIRAALESYQTDFGDYPPSRIQELDESVQVNDINNGIEALTASLMTEKKNGPYLNWDTDRYANNDDDSVSKNVTNWFFGDKELRELTDQWHNPIVYIHYRNYKTPEKLGKYHNRKGDEFKVKAARNSDTNTFYNPTGFQLWSFGPDLKNNNGSGDDVTGW